MLNTVGSYVHIKSFTACRREGYLSFDEQYRSFTDKIYIFAGYDGNNRVNDFWQYDTEHEVGI